ncbi:MAG: cysteine desulfurase [Firmicutes bacterium]|nr:cysteine desulfurase [Bacillota bacterium]
MTVSEAYLDNSATTRPYPEVTRAVAETMAENYGNPSSLHRKGVAAERALTQARERVAASLNVTGGIIFTGGGTEAINLALKGLAPGKRGRHVIATSVEHPAVLNVCEQLRAQGIEVTLLPVNQTGIVDPEQLRAQLRDDTYLVSTIHVNNEVGAVQPLADIAAVLADWRRDRRRVFWHVDAVQAYGKLALRPRELGVDLLSVSAHKVHGPKGVGALYAAPQTPLRPLLSGGGQEGGLRSGTENVPGIAGFGVAAALLRREGVEAAEKMRRLKKQLVEGILAGAPEAVLNGPPLADGNGNPDSAPHIANISFPGLPGEVLVHALEQEGIFVSTGAACSSRKKTGSDVLKAMGLSAPLLAGAIRFSLAPVNTAAEMDFAVAKTLAVVRELRRLYGQ